jgi:hypothetical protein
MLAMLFKTVSGLNAAEIQGPSYRRLHGEIREMRDEITPHKTG